MVNTEVPQGNLSKRSVAYVRGLGVCYASPDGIVAVAGVGGVDDRISSAKVGSTFEFSVISTSTGVGTLTVNTGWTLVGSGLTTASGFGAIFRARKTGDGTYTCYRIG